MPASGSLPGLPFGISQLHVYELRQRNATGICIRAVTTTLGGGQAILFLCQYPHQSTGVAARMASLATAFTWRPLSMRPRMATDREKEWALKASRFIKAEVKRAGIAYAELARRLNEHGLEETEGGIAAKLARGSFAVTFWLACLTVLGIATIALEDL